MSNLIFTENTNIELIDQFTFKCVHCGHKFNISDVERTCPKCSNELFPNMFRNSFTEIFANVLETLNVDSEKIKRFFGKSNIRLRSLGICNKLSTIIDMNLEIQFGGQYKSFTVKDSYHTIIKNNFDGGN